MAEYKVQIEETQNTTITIKTISDVSAVCIVDIGAPEIIAVIFLKFEQGGLSIQ